MPGSAPPRLGWWLVGAKHRTGVPSLPDACLAQRMPVRFAADRHPISGSDQRVGSRQLSQRPDQTMRRIVDAGMLLATGDCLMAGEPADQTKQRPVQLPDQDMRQLEL